MYKKISKCCFLYMIFTFLVGVVQSESLLNLKQDFRVQGCFYIIKESDYQNTNTTYHTLNHEGGVKAKILSYGKNDIQNQEQGQWYFVMLLSGQWLSDEEWLQSGSKVWIFIPNETEIFFD